MVNKLLTKASDGSLPNIKVLEDIIRKTISKQFDFTEEEKKKCIYTTFTDGELDCKNFKYVDKEYDSDSTLLLFTNNFTGSPLLEIDLVTLQIEDSFLSYEADKEIEKLLETLK